MAYKKEILIISVKIILILFIIVFLSYVTYTNFFKEHELPRWHCDKIDCGDVVFIDGNFSGSPLYFRLKNCRTINCTEVQEKI